MLESSESEHKERYDSSMSVTDRATRKVVTWCSIVIHSSAQTSRTGGTIRTKSRAGKTGFRVKTLPRFGFLVMLET
jgi:hypothetical protein